MSDDVPRRGRDELIDAAERLIAERGPSVSLRQVLNAAGQRNGAAIRYHFGTREDLIAAVVDARQAVFEPQRLELLTALEAHGEVTRRGLLEALLNPVFRHQQSADPSFHARFMEKIRDFPGLALVNRDDWIATTLILNRLAALLGPSSGEERAARTRGVVTVVFALLADLEREQFDTPEHRAVAEDAVLDMVLGAVNAGAAQPTEPTPT